MSLAKFDIENTIKEEIWDEAYTFGLSEGKEAGLDVAKQQLAKVFQSAYDIVNIELRLLKQNRDKGKHRDKLHDPWRGMDQ